MPLENGTVTFFTSFERRTGAGVEDDVLWLGLWFYLSDLRVPSRLLILFRHNGVGRRRTLRLIDHLLPSLLAATLALLPSNHV